MIRKVLSHPVTLFNVILVGTFIMIQGLHMNAHHKMDVDVESYVHKFLKKNPGTCAKFDY